MARYRAAPLPQPPEIEGKRKKSYFGTLLIGPIKCQLSVKLNESATSHNGFVMAMLQSGLSAIGAYSLHVFVSCFLLFTFLLPLKYF
jgi:hypothetical protein